MGRQESGGVVVQTDDGGLKTMVFGWVAVILSIGVGVASIILSSWLGVALTIVSAGLGIALICVGAGEGVRRARLGRAAEIAAKAQLAAVRRNQLPPRWEG